MKINSIYVGVKNMTRAINFYKNLFQKEPEEINERFTSFDINEISFSLYNSEIDGEKMVFGNNCVPNIEVENINQEFEKIKKLDGMILGEIEDISGYKIFQFKDPEGNTIEFYETAKE